MDELIRHVESKHRRSRLPALMPGDTVRVHQRIKEGDRERIQIFEGVVIGIGGSGMGRTVTVRKRSFGVNVERIFPVHAPAVAEFEVVRRGRVRRAKLYYLRGKTGRATRISAMAGAGEAAEAGEGGMPPSAEATAGEAALPDKKA
jgi:large subunit ribosomal protein L19